ncbi:MAG: hypothetical protein OEV40_04915 [Acidimicrobiia bacterium]|nr:hypothetical protein [Acidimicrobiia bacterium]
MAEAIIFAVIVVVVIPVGFLMSTTLAAGALGALLKTDAERRNADSELLDTNY